MHNIISEWWEVMGNPGHAAAEFTYFLIEVSLEFLIGGVIFKKWLKRHDEKVHGK